MKGLRWALVSQGIASGGQFLVTLTLVRLLGLGDFGVLAAILILAGYGAGLVQALCAQPFLSLPSPSDLRRGSAFLALVISAGAGMAAGLLSSVLGSGAFGLSALLAGALVAARSVVPLARALAHGEGRVRSLLAVDSIGAFGALGLILVQGPGLDLAGAARALASASGAAAVLGILGGLSARYPASRDSALRGHGSTADSIARLWRSGRWLALNQAFSWLGTGGVHGAALLHLGPASVGALRLAQTVVGLPLAALQALDLVLPRAAREALEQGRLGAWTRRMAGRATILFAAFGAALAASAGWLVHGILRPEQGGEFAVEALAWLAFSPALAALTGVLHVGFRAREDTASIFLCYASSSVAAAACAAPLVRTFGVNGAAAGLLGGQALFAAGLWVLWRSREGRSVRHLLQKLV